MTAVSTANTSVVNDTTTTSGYFLKGQSNVSSQPVLTGYTASQGSIEYVSDVALVLSDTASTGAIEVVVAVECDDGSVIETTKYLSLHVTKHTLSFS